jgi:hypothetical protein
MTTTDDVQAAGRSISGANADRLKTAHQSLVSGEQILRQVLMESGYLPLTASSHYSSFDHPAPVEAAALSLSAETQLRLWVARVDTALALCYQRLATNDPNDSAADTIASTLNALREAIADLPPPSARDRAWSGLDIYYRASDYGCPCDGLIEGVDREVRSFRLVTAIRFFLDLFFRRLHDLTEPAEAMSLLIDELGKVLSSLDAHPTTNNSGLAIESEIEVDPMESEAIAVEASSGEYEAVWALTLAAATTADLEAVDDDDDAVPIEGVLFRVDEPSECAPMVGPRLPMLITSDVAAAAMKRVLGCPLDADESLESHGGTIVGAITAGAVVGKDAVIRGFLHGHHLPQKVAEIRAAARAGDLGMSMIGSVSWHRGKVGGRDVAVVDRLKLKGGTILRASAATYQKTRVRLLSAVDQNGRALPVAAAAEDVPLVASATPETSDTPTIPTISKPDPMSSPIEASDLSTIVEAIAAKLLPPIESLNDRLVAVEAKQREAEAQSEAERLAAEAAKAEAEAIEAMAGKVIEAISPTLDERIRSVLNAGRPVAATPRRLTTSPLVPGTPTPVAASSDDRIAVLTAQLERTPPHNLAARFSLKQQIADLQTAAAIGQYQ